MEEEGPQSSFMFLVTCNEAFGYSHEQILDSSFVLLVGMLRRRVKDFHSEDTSIKEEDGEWVEMVDFDTGHVKRIKKVLSA